MAAIDFIPELLTVGTFASSFVGLYFDRIRKRIERDEPKDVERAANQAVADNAAEVQLKPVAQMPSAVIKDGEVTLSEKDLQSLLDNVVTSAVGAAVAGMKSELSVERVKDRRAGFRRNRPGRTARSGSPASAI